LGMPSVIGEVVAGLGRIGFGTRTAAGGSGRFFHDHFGGGIEVKNALAGIADDYLLATAYFVIRLRTKHDLASRAFVIANFCKTCLEQFDIAIIVPEEIDAYAG